MSELGRNLFPICKLCLILICIGMTKVSFHPIIRSYKLHIKIIKTVSLVGEAVVNTLVTHYYSTRKVNFKYTT